MTYAQAVQKNKSNNCHIGRGQKALLVSPLNKHSRPPIVIDDPVHANNVCHTSLNCVKKTKVLHNKENVPVPVFNRFTVLASLSEDNAACSNQSISRDSSGYNTELNIEDTSRRSFQHSRERKYPSSFGSFQPKLAVQANSISYGNKNETGFLAVGRACTKTHPEEFSVTNVTHSDVLPCGTPQVGRKFSHPSQDLGIVHQPQLAGRNQSFLGNKSKTGHLHGDIIDANVLKNVHVMCEKYAGATDVMDTVHLDQELEQNCSLNINSDSSHLRNFSCDTVDTERVQTFGFIPKGPLKLYDGDPGFSNNIPDIITAHLLIRNSCRPNYLGCRIPVVSNLKYHIWSQYLEHYWDKQLPDLLKFGFPLDFDRTSLLHSTEENHKSALVNASHVDKYISEELQHGAILGPFDTKPINLHTSPLMVRDKQDSDSKRTIMDLSWPEGHSVNYGVSKDVYLGTQFVLKYPSIDSTTSSLRKLGPAAMIYKIDISRAFRQIKVDPGDIDLLGLKLIISIFSIFRSLLDTEMEARSFRDAQMQSDT